jgi:hypothetical protein
MTRRFAPRRTASLLAALLACALVTGCAGSSGSDDPGVARVAGVTFAEARQLLDARASAVRRDDLRAFLRGVDPHDHALVARQRRYFLNLERLPLATYSLVAERSQWPTALRSRSWGPGVLVPQVRVAIQLRGYDAAPVQRVTGFAIARVDGRPMVVSELTGAGHPYPGFEPAPWDLVRIHVHATPDSLQLYDDVTWHQEPLVNAVLTSSITDVARGLPFPWTRHVVVYVFARRVVLRSYLDVPGGNLELLGAMTFPMYAVPGQSTVAATRFTLLPSSLQAGRPFLDRIVRHELTHVAVGPRDDGVPTWMAEGIAEYVGARDLPEGQRRIASVALVRARGQVDAMPASATFNGPDQAWNYALAWMACDYVAATQGEARLWELMAALHADGAGTSDAAQDPIVTSVLGFDSHELARRAARRIQRIYG